MSPIIITATWDPETGVWVAESEQLPLVTEAPTIDGLMAKLPGIIRDLLELDDGDFAAGDEAEVPFEVVAHMHETVRVRRRRA
jgi:hypothetical protein